jgi:hypothetical protein
MLRLRAANGAAAVLPSVLHLGVPVPPLARALRPVNAGRQTTETAAVALLEDKLGATEIPPDCCRRCGRDYLPDGTCRHCTEKATA